MQHDTCMGPGLEHSGLLRTSDGDGVQGEVMPHHLESHRHLTDMGQGARQMNFHRVSSTTAVDVLFEVQSSMHLTYTYISSQGRQNRRSGWIRISRNNAEIYFSGTVNVQRSLEAHTHDCRDLS